MTASIGERLALPFAAFLAIVEVVRNWGDWGPWAFWVVDYVAVTLLLWGWWAARHRKPGAHSVLSGAWGFTCAMFYISFFSHVYRLNPPGGPLDPRFLTAGAGVLFGITVVAFASTLAARC